jgi:hypothetical protein
MGGDVTGPVRDRPEHLAAVPERGQGAEVRARRAVVGVVDGDRETAVQGPYGPGPGRIPWVADLRAQARLVHQRPPPGEPVRVGSGYPAAQPLRPVRCDQDHPGLAVGVRLRHVDGDVVEPLVGEDQPADGSRFRQVGKPGDALVEAVRAGRPFDGAEVEPVGDRTWSQCGEHAREQLAAPRAHVDQRQLGRVPQRLVHPPQQLRDGAGEER